MTRHENNGSTKFFGSLGPWDIKIGRVGAITQYTEKKSEKKVMKIKVREDGIGDTVEAITHTL